MNVSIFGYFDDPSQQSAAYDPGLTALCPHCLRVLDLPVITISLMRQGSPRSYFYRVHRSCHLRANSTDIQRVESSLIDAEETP